MNKILNQFTMALMDLYFIIYASKCTLVKLLTKVTPGTQNSSFSIIGHYGRYYYKRKYGER